MKKVLVTGATGFVGRPFVEELVTRGCDVRVMVRDSGAGSSFAPGVIVCPMGDLVATRSFADALCGVDTVFHLAARAHVVGDQGAQNEELYRASNIGVTDKLAREAVAASVSRFVLVSSIKVFGERDRGHSFRPNDPANPVDAYGRSKLGAEHALWSACQSGKMEGVVVRPPLIYGAGARANILRLMRLVDRGMPLPLAAVRNRRSLVSVRNLIDLLCLCGSHKDAPGRLLLVSDDTDVSTPELLRSLADSMRRRLRLVRMPVPLLKISARIAGLSAEVDRLTDSLTVDLSTTKSLLGWSPPRAFVDEIAVTVEHYLRFQRNGADR